MKNLLLVLALAVLTGCSTLALVGPPLTQEAACQLAMHNPAANRWLRLAGEVFIEFSSDEIPTPAVVQAKLESLQAFGLSSAEQRLVWGSFVVTYKTIYSPNLSAEKQDQLRDFFLETGMALQEGAKCSTQTVNTAKWLEPLNLNPVTTSISARLKAAVK